MGINLDSVTGRGWFVFPCQPGTKIPAVKRWEQVATPTHHDDWFRRHHHNIGIACGPSRLVVIDIDTHNPGRTGLDVFADLTGQDWPDTYTVRTPSGGLHLYFTAPADMEIRNSAGRLGPGIDVRACGGFVLAAGSVIGARAYEVVSDRDPIPLPDWLTRLLAGSRGTRTDSRPRLVATLT